MKVVFLDWDGVLTSMTSGGRVIPAAVEWLNRLCRKTGASIVVSASARGTLPDTRAQLRSVGVTAPVVGCTPKFHQGPTSRGIQRGDEITAWIGLQRRRIESYVILDDDTDMGDLRARLVQVRYQSGLQLADVDRAVLLLRKPLSEG